jgi:hypothetical protein
LSKNGALRCSCEQQLISVKKPDFGSPRCGETTVRVDLNQQLLYKFALTIVVFVRNPWVQPAIFDQRLEVDVDQALPRVRGIVLDKSVQRYDASIICSPLRAS